MWRLHQTDAVAEGVAGSDGVTDEHVARFHEQGFLVIDDAFGAEEVRSGLDGLLDLIDGRHQGFTGVQLEAKVPDRLASMPWEQKQDAIRKLMGFVDYDQRLQALSTHSRLTAVFARILGELPELFQDLALLKPPLIGREKPWRQDNAFFSLQPDSTIAGAWIALDEALPENGCMHIIPGTHRGASVPHFQRRDWPSSTIPLGHGVPARVAKQTVGKRQAGRPNITAHRLGSAGESKGPIRASRSH